VSGQQEDPVRICKICDQILDYSKPDPCLGYLPGVKYACCGHGETDTGYISFENGTIVYFDMEFIIDWNSFNDSIKLDEKTGGVRRSDLKHIIFRDKRKDLP